MSGVGQLRDGDPLDYLELKYLTWQNQKNRLCKTKRKWWALRDSNTGPADSGYQSFHPDLDYIITHSIICLGAGRYWCITQQVRAAPPSLCTFLSRLTGLAQDCHRHYALRFP
jgi:hypothetical protein